MADAIAFIQWDSYAEGTEGRGFFAAKPLTFNSRQERLHNVSVGGRLWLVSRNPADGQLIGGTKAMYYSRTCVCTRCCCRVALSV